MKKSVKYSLIVSAIVVIFFLPLIGAYFLFGPEYVNNNSEAIGQLSGKVLVFLIVAGIFIFGVRGILKLARHSPDKDNSDVQNNNE